MTPRGVHELCEGLWWGVLDVIGVERGDDIDVVALDGREEVVV